MPAPERTLINHTIALAETVPEKEGGRAWMALNMATEAKAGFGAFTVGTKETGREIDFIALRKAQAAATPWSEELIADLMPGRRG